MNAYLCIVTWPDGTEGLLFPRPGNVPIAQTEEHGQADLKTAQEHLAEFVKRRPDFAATKVRLVRFEEVADLAGGV